MQKTIYLMDDDRDDLLLLIQAFLKRAPTYRLVPFSNITRLLTALAGLQVQELPSMFIIDVFMPGVNGIQVLEALNQHDRLKQIPKVMFSASDFDTDKQRAYANGAKCYYLKPFDMTQMNQIIDSMLECLAAA